MQTLRAVLFSFCLVQAATAAQNLDIYFIDVEGGQATLIVAPSGESLLVDTGWPGFGGRDAGRIVAAAHSANLKRIDYALVTHYHMDHVGGVPQLAERIPVGTFVDHGSNAESGKEADELFDAYQKVSQKVQRRVVAPGDTFALGQVKMEVLTANGLHIGTSLPGAGQPNPYCSAVKREEDDPGENARSVGILLTFGKFRFVDLGDLTWNKELDLMCPDNRIGSVDVYLTSHHGLSISGSKALVWALHPRVAIMNNGARKGGEEAAWQVVKSSPGLKDLWQLHYALAGGPEHNVADSYVANPDEKCEGKYLKLSARPNGSFSVTNSRNGFSRSYSPAL
jgi:beta-lactamase superfamily II metal-dependent hydrolase